MRNQILKAQEPKTLYQRRSINSTIHISTKTNIHIKSNQINKIDITKTKSISHETHNKISPTYNPPQTSPKKQNPIS